MDERELRQRMRRCLGRSLRGAAFAGLTVLGMSAPARADIVLAGIAEASGSAAPAGRSFQNGYTMAVGEIKAAGGVLGQRFSLTSFDIETRPEAAADAAKQAVALRPFAVLGPVFSGLTLAAMPATATLRIPHFTGGEAASLTQRFHPSLLRTSLNQQASMPRLASFVFHGLGLKTVGMLWIDNEFGRDGKTVLAQVSRSRGGSVAFERGIKPGSTDFSAAVRDLIAANVDAAVLYLNEVEAIEALKELRRQSYDKPIVGDGPLASQKVLEGAGFAAEGLLAHTGIAVQAPQPAVQSFVKRYQARFGSLPDHNAVKGYFAVQVIRAGLMNVGKVDRAAFLADLRDHRLDRRAYPELMTSVSYDFFGDLNRDSYFLTVRNGQTTVLASMNSTASSFVDLLDGRQIAFNSKEFRQELVKSLRGARQP